MKENKLSKTKFSKMCGISVTYLNKFLTHNGRRLKNLHIDKIAKVVNVSKYDLIYDKGLKILMILMEEDE